MNQKVIPVINEEVGLLNKYLEMDWKIKEIHSIAEYVYFILEKEKEAVD